MIALIVAGAAAVTLGEKMPFEDTLYFALVTGGNHRLPRYFLAESFRTLEAILIGFIGIIFTGLLVAVLVHAVRESFEESDKRG